MAESKNQSPSGVLDLLLDNGLILPPSNDICCPPCDPYVLGSAEVVLKYIGASQPTCCYNIAASVETYLKFAEEYSGSVCENDSSFSDCVAEIQNLLTPSEYITFLQSGLVEFGHIGADDSGESWVCILATYLQSSFNLQTNSPAVPLSEMLSTIQDKGIVISCIPEGFIIGSVEAYLKWAEATRGGLPPQ